MGKYFKIFLALFSCLFLTACQEGGEAGDLLGQWRAADSDTKYISFSGSLTLMHSTTEHDVFGNFQHRGDSLFIQCYSVHGDRSDTTIVEQTFGFRPFANIRVRIDRMDSDWLVLSKDGQTWRFYKY